MTISIKIVPYRDASEKQHVCKSTEPEQGPNSGAWAKYNDRQEKLFEAYMAAIHSGDSGRSRAAAREYLEALGK